MTDPTVNELLCCLCELDLEAMFNLKVDVINQ